VALGLSVALNRHSQESEGIMVQLDDLSVGTVAGLIAAGVFIGMCLSVYMFHQSVVEANSCSSIRDTDALSVAFGGSFGEGK